MVKCPRCGHQNLPSFTTCSRCGTQLGGAGPDARLPPTAMGAPQPQGDDYARLMASRASASRRTRSVYSLVVLAALAGGGYVWYRDYAQKKGRQDKLDYFERWADLEKRETGAFFSCVMASEVDMNLVQNAGQIQQRVESAYFTQQKTFSDHLLTECVPKIERARQAFGGLRDTPSELAEPVAKYAEVLPKLQTSIEDYAERIKGRQSVKDVDQLVQEMGGAWHSDRAPTPEGIAFEKFMHCAVPGLAKMKDTQEMLEFLADACYKKDAVAFMDRVRKDCGPILNNASATKATPSATWKVSQKKFYEEEARQLRAWESCGKRSRKGKKAEELGSFLLAVGEYMEARTGVVKAARDIKDSAK
jgi:hypothetical protein